MCVYVCVCVRARERVCWLVCACLRSASVPRTGDDLPRYACISDKSGTTLRARRQNRMLVQEHAGGYCN